MKLKIQIALKFKQQNTSKAGQKNANYFPHPKRMKQYRTCEQFVKKSIKNVYNNYSMIRDTIIKLLPVCTGCCTEKKATVFKTIKTFIITGG